VASIYVPARAVAAPARAPRARVSRLVREVAMLLALAAPAALAQQAQPVNYDATWNQVPGGAGDSSADRFNVVGVVAIVGPASSGGAFSANPGMMSSMLLSSAPNDAIFVSSFD